MRPAIRAALGGLLLVAPAALAAQKPSVQVTFRLAAPTYVTRLTAAERRRIEEAVGSRVRDTLAQRLQFVSFVSDQPAPYRLTISLDRRDRAADTDSLSEVGFHATLAESERELVSTYLLTFRSADAALDPLGTAEVLRLEIEHKLGRLTDAHMTQLVDQVLSRVPVAGSTVVWRKDLTGWVLPRSPRDFCLDLRSVLNVEGDFLKGPLTMRHEVKAQAARLDLPAAGGAADTVPRIFAMPLTPIPPVPDTVRVLAVYMREYRLDPLLCPRLTPPGDVTFAGPGSGP
jgi:hypothetical protein